MRDASVITQIVKQMQANKHHIKVAKPTQFHERWLKAYGLVRVTARDAATGIICSAECRFCRAFGKEGSNDHGRAPRSKIKLFTKPWRQDHMKTHMLAQHPERFKEYAALPLGEKGVILRRL